MPADSPASTSQATGSAHPAPASTPARAAGWIAAVILLSGFALHTSWAAGGQWAAAPDFAPLLPPLLAVAQVAVLTVGAAALLLARIGVLPVPLPRWLQRLGPWVLSAVFGAAALQSLLAMAAVAGPDGQADSRLSDVQGPLFLLLAVACAIVARADRHDRRAT